MTCNNANIDGGQINIGNASKYNSKIITSGIGAMGFNATSKICPDGMDVSTGGTNYINMYIGTYSDSSVSNAPSGYISLYCSNGDHTDVRANGIVTPDLVVNGNFLATGRKNRAVKINDREYVLLNAYETATPYFGDIGSNKTDENGYCKIDIEEIFSQTIELEGYKVFIQECGNGQLYVEKHDKYFEVKGTPNLEFDWELKAIQKGYKNVRLEIQELKGENNG